MKLTKEDYIKSQNNIKNIEVLEKNSMFVTLTLQLGLAISQFNESTRHMGVFLAAFSSVFATNYYVNGIFSKKKQENEFVDIMLKKVNTDDINNIVISKYVLEKCKLIIGEDESTQLHVELNNLNKLVNDFCKEKNIDLSNENIVKSYYNTVTNNLNAISFLDKKTMKGYISYLNNENQNIEDFTSLLSKYGIDLEEFKKDTNLNNIDLLNKSAYLVKDRNYQALIKNINNLYENDKFSELSQENKLLIKEIYVDLNKLNLLCENMENMNKEQKNENIILIDNIINANIKLVEKMNSEINHSIQKEMKVLNQNAKMRV